MLRTVVLALLLILGGAAASATWAQTATSAPRTFLFDAKQLQLTRQRIEAGDKALAPAWAKLEREAQKALRAGPFSIVNKPATPPSGDKHDYLSQAPYFWPDPKSPNGLPYIRRDGERNPEINKITDHASLDDLENSAETRTIRTSRPKMSSLAVSQFRNCRSAVSASSGILAIHVDQTIGADHCLLGWFTLCAPISISPPAASAATSCSVIIRRSA